MVGTRTNVTSAPVWLAALLGPAVVASAGEARAAIEHDRDIQQGAFNA